MLLCFESFRLHIFEWKGVKCSVSRMIQNGNYYEANRLRHQHEPIQIVAGNVFIFIIWYDSGFIFINIPDMHLGIHFIGKFTNMKETWHRCYITTRLINMNSISNYARCEFWILPTNRYRYIWLFRNGETDVSQLHIKIVLSGDEHILSTFVVCNAI